MDRETLPWIVGGLALAGLAYYLYRRRQEPREDEVPVVQEPAGSLEPSNLVHFPAQHSETFQ